MTFYFVKPAPPKTIVLAMAADEGGFRYFARKYQEKLAKHGITLELRQTQGSVTSVELLADESSGVDVAFVQSGTGAGRRRSASSRWAASRTSRCGCSTGASPWTTCEGCRASASPWGPRRAARATSR